MDLSLSVIREDFSQMQTSAALQQLISSPLRFEVSFVRHLG